VPRRSGRCPATLLEPRCRELLEGPRPVDQCGIGDGDHGISLSKLKAKRVSAQRGDDYRFGVLAGISQTEVLLQVVSVNCQISQALMGPSPGGKVLLLYRFPVTVCADAAGVAYEAGCIVSSRMSCQRSQAVTSV
jgi:hypothetical protein